MSNKQQNLVASVKRTELVTIDVSALDKRRAYCALLQIEGMYKTNDFILRDMVTEEHEPFIYYSGSEILSHQFKDGKVTIFKEEYTLASANAPAI